MQTNDRERIRRKLECNSISIPESGCQVWMGRWKPYGTISIHNHQYSVHRVAWELANGPIPDGLFVCHHCDVPACFRIDHLFLGTSNDNLHDAIRKGLAFNQKHREAISSAMKDRKFSVETRAKLSQAQKGKRNFLGKRHSEQTKAKMRASATGRILTAETRLKISLAKQGRKYAKEA